ncbi:MAG: glycoside hydrolase family 3 N-terminal domain-containing protein [Lachnospiraceae bacterium]
MGKARRKFERIAALFFTAVFLFIAAVSGTACARPASSGQQEPTPVPQADKSVYMDASRPVTERVEALLAQMTLDEKLAQMVQPEQNEAAGGASPEDVKKYGIGSVLSGGGSAPASGNSAKDWQERVLAYELAALDTRLGIPLLYGVDAVHGHNNVDSAVIFPHNIGLGAAGEEELAECIGAAVAEEIRATGILWTFAPTVGLPYNERWGRTYECFGEEAELVSRLGAAYIRGFQGNDLTAADAVIATAKHYIGEGQTEHGVNQGNVTMEEAEFEVLLQSELLEPYRAAVEAGVRSVMVSYNSIQGLKCHENNTLITEVLKGELGFTGIVVSDYNGIDQVQGATYAEKVKACVNAGMDVFMEPYDWKTFLRELKKLVENGEVSMERIDDAVRRILTVKFELGLFEKSAETLKAEADEMLENFGSEEHRELAREAVRKSLVLLKNDNPEVFSVLQSATNLQVVGRKADDIGVQCGGWTISWQGAEGDITEGTTILEGIREVAGEEVTVEFSSRGKVSAEAEAVIVVVGETPYAETNGDVSASKLKLSEEDKKVIQTVLETKAENNPDVPVILILLSGRPVTIAEELDAADAIVAAWLPGTEGAGIADVLLGDYEFSGTLSYTWPWYAQDIEEKFTDDSKVLFVRGTGLRKNGSSIFNYGTVEIGEAPEAPQEAAGAVYIGEGIDLAASDYVIEAEWRNGDSYVVEEGTDGEVIYMDNWSTQWANTKWNVFVPQSGSYVLHFKIAAEKAVKGVALYYNTPYITDDGNANRTELTIPATGGLSEYGDVTLAVELSAGLYEFKLMATSAGARFRLDSVTFEPIEVSGETVNTAPVEYHSEGEILAEGVVKGWATEAVKPADSSWYQSPMDIPYFLTKLPALDITTVDTQELFTISIDPNITYQTMLGIGTSMEESTVNHLKELEPEVRHEFIRYLLDMENGAGMTLFRLTIGTADFTAQPFYTYYDAAELTGENTVNGAPDWYNETGNGFSVQKDIDYQIIATVQEILEVAEELGVREEIRFFASPWTPPGWMKQQTASSRSYADNELLLKGGRLSDEHIDDLAMYYVRYLEEYKKLGIDIDAITLQNEPLLEIDYPSCAVTAEQEGKLAVAIREKLAQSEILADCDIKLWAYDHNPDSAVNYVTKLFSVEGAKDAVDGIAFHDYSDPISAMSELSDTLLDDTQTVALTERSVWGTQGADRMLQYFRNGAISYNAWVTMLDSKISKHQWVGTPGPTLFVRDWQSTDDYWATPEVGIIGQFSRFVRPGAVRIESDYGDAAHVTSAAWRSAEGERIVVVLVNQTALPQPVKLVFEEKQVLAVVPAKQVVTYEIPCE